MLLPAKTLRLGGGLVATVLALAATVIILSGMTSGQPPKSCTILSVAVGGEVFFAANEDYQNPNTVIGFFPASSQGYGHIDLGYRNSDGSLSWQLGVNDQGLVWDGNSLPAVPLNDHPERPHSGFGNYLAALLSSSVSVGDAVELIGLYDFSGLGGSMNFQIHLADTTGDAVVIGPGPDGELAFTGKAGDAYLVSTNFNRAMPTPEKDPETHARYDKSVEMLEGIVASQDLDVDHLGEILETTHVEALDAFTLYSAVIDLKGGVVHINHMSDFDNAVDLDIDEELSKGERIVAVEDLFSEQVANRAASRYRAVVIRDVLLRVILAGATILAIGVLVLSAVHRLRSTEAKSRQRKWVPLSLLGLAISCASWSAMLMIWHSYAPGIANSRPPNSLTLALTVSSTLGGLGLALFVASVVVLSKTRTVTDPWHPSRGSAAVGIPMALAAIYLIVGVVKLFTDLY